MDAASNGNAAEVDPNQLLELHGIIKQAIGMLKENEEENNTALAERNIEGKGREGGELTTSPERLRTAGPLMGYPSHPHSGAATAPTSPPPPPPEARGYMDSDQQRDLAHQPDLAHQRSREFAQQGLHHRDFNAQQAQQRLASPHTPTEPLAGTRESPRTDTEILQGLDKLHVLYKDALSIFMEFQSICDCRYIFVIVFLYYTIVLIMLV